MDRAIDHDGNRRPPRGVATARLREMLELARAKGGLSIGEALEAMGPTSIAFTILFLAIPALTPIPGPFGMVFGTALALVSLQIVAGGRKVWLPAIIRDRRVSSVALDLIVGHAVPVIARVEKLVRAGRLQALTGRTVQALLGIPVFLLAVVIALPIPFGNILPVLSLVVLAVALMERDGLVTLIGLLLTSATIVATAALLYFIKAMIFTAS
ncbi:exopolysaccharide biosynthesis protein [Rhizobium anhuiense]|uniref:exopolysaccharide biosynthesis protein n=1 Tax=Rhizobium anhuiense TaxID=1184720 RepID=UPI000BEACF04|nr:exopolysaccharide biosynthesis protein [Rhizobium anhuiense]PDS56386.1 exopolysaccharide biosynthesis protein [Rhizobium anhuiense]UTS93344.1 exopolysaccharide biosynthesis protein [Rhizobium anhuiense bv. trifolii]